MDMNKNLITIVASVGLSALATPIMVLVLPTQREDALAAGPHLQVLGIALIFICLDSLRRIAR